MTHPRWDSNIRLSPVSCVIVPRPAATWNETIQPRPWRCFRSHRAGNHAKISLFYGWGKTYFLDSPNTLLWPDRGLHNKEVDISGSGCPSLALSFWPFVSLPNPQKTVIIVIAWHDNYAPSDWTSVVTPSPHAPNDRILTGHVLD